MIIRSCHIAAFGKWQEEDFHFTSSLNPFLWENGEGKTTLLHFFLVMFYGLSGERKQDVSENERKHFMPFRGGKFGGNIHFQENGKEYILERSFGLRKAEDSFRLLEEGGKESHDYTENIGEELFSLDRDAFQRVAMLSHEDFRLQFNSSIHAKLGNVSDDEEDMKKFQKVQNTLKDAINALSPNRRTGAIFKKKMEEENLSAGLLRKEEAEQAVLSLEEEVLSLEEEWKKKSEEEEALAEDVQKGIREKEALGKKVEYKKLSEELEKAHFRYENAKKWYYQERFETLSEEEKDSLWKKEVEELKEKIFALKNGVGTEEKAAETSTAAGNEDAQTWHNPLPFAFSGFALLFLLLFFAKISGASLAVPGSLFLLIALLLFSVSLAIFYGEAERKKRFSLQKGEEEERRKKRETLRMASLEELLLRFHKLEEMFSLEKEETERQEALTRFLEEEGNEGVAGEEGGESLSLEEAQQRLESHRRAQEALKDRIREKREEREEKAEAVRQLSEQKRKLHAVRAEREAMEERIHILQETKEYLEEAKDAFSSEYRGPILSAFTVYFKELSNLELQFSITNDLEIEFLEGGLRRNLAYLSEGLQDLCRFAMKLAVFDAMFPEGAPVLFLDDPFSHFDDEKGERGRELLKKLAEHRQILYFTCASARMIQEEPKRNADQ